MNKKDIKIRKDVIAAQVNEKPNYKSIDIIAQAFYGNRTATSIGKEDIDSFILKGMCRYNCDALDSSKIRDALDGANVDRTIVEIPNSKCVLVYNKYTEEEILEEMNTAPEERPYCFKPVAEIPELNLKIFSRCIVCGIDDDGEICSIPKDDDGGFFKYLSY